MMMLISNVFWIIISAIVPFMIAFSALSVNEAYWTAASAIASFCMVFITAVSVVISLQQNKKNRENNTEQNRLAQEMQIRAMNYQTKIVWIDKLKEGIAYAQDIFSFAVQDKFIEYQNKDIDIPSAFISELFENGNKAKRRLVSILYGNGQYEENFLLFVDEFCKRYWDLVLDLQFLHSLEFSIKQEQLREKTNSYKQSQRLSNLENRIWSIIESRNYSSNNDDFAYYTNELTKRYGFDVFERNCLALLKYELNSANEILNGTEQTK